MKLPATKTFSALIRAYGAYLAALFVRGLELVGKLGLYMLAARVLGVHEAGLFFLCITWVLLISTLTRVGFEKAVMRHVAAELAVGKGREARLALLEGTGWVTLGGILGTATTILFAEPLALHAFGEPGLTAPLVVAASAILPQTLCIFAGHALTGFNRGVMGQFVQNGLWPVLTLAALAVGIHSLDGILYALAAANLASALLGLVFILWGDVPKLKAVPAPDDDGEAVENLPRLWRTALPLGIVEVVQISLNSLPVLLLAAFGEPSQVGAFSVANRISMLIWVVIISIGTIAAPRFAAHHRQGEWDELRALNRKVRLAVASFGVPVVLVMMIFPSTLLHLIGPGFEIAATALVIMSVGQLVNALLPCQDIMLAMTGHGGVLRWLNAAQLTSCCVLCAVLIPLFGMTGAAVATAIFIAQGGIGTTLMVRRLMPQVL